MIGQDLFETIEELKSACDKGEIDESKLSVVLDNDCTNFYNGPCEDEAGGEIENDVMVSEAGGYRDIEPLYKLLFPKATVEWC